MTTFGADPYPGRFPKAPSVPRGPGGVPAYAPDTGLPEAAGRGNPLGPRTISTTTPTAELPGGGMTLDALMQRQKELAAKRNPMGDMTSPMQGIAYALREGLQGYQEGSASREAADAQGALGGALSAYIGGDHSPEVMATLGRYDPDTMLALWKVEQDKASQEHWTPIATPQGESGQWFQNQNGDTKKVGGGEGAGGPKESDVNSMADDFANVPDVKNFQNAQSMWLSMQDAATTDTAQADLNMVIAAAKLFDPTSVVRTEEGEMVRDTGGLPSGLYGTFLRLTGKKGSRLGRDVRQGLMHEAFSRMNSYHKGVLEASKWFGDKATRRGYNPADIVRPFTAPVEFDPEKVIGSDSPAEPAEPAKPAEPAAPTKDEAGNTIVAMPDGGTATTSPDGSTTTFKDKAGRVTGVRRNKTGGGQ